MTRKRNQTLLETARILVVDDDEGVRRLLRRHLDHLGYRVEEASTAEEAFEKLLLSTPDLILLDVQLPGRSGHDVLKEVRADYRTRLLPIVMLTGAATREDKMKAIEEGVTDFIAKPFSAEELMARVRSLVQLKFFADSLEDAETVIASLAKTIDARDPYTATHSERVSRYAGLLGERIGLTGSDLAAVKRGGLFHDIGKIAVRDNVLLKPGKLTPEEYHDIKRHPVEGRNLLQKLRTLAFALPVVYHHHERMDGSGYPEGLMGESIPIAARVTTIADIFDALTSERIYRGALSRAETLAIMEEETKRGWWDPHLLDEFRGLLDSYQE